jgi:hypothetical protein
LSMFGWPSLSENPAPRHWRMKPQPFGTALEVFGRFFKISRSSDSVPPVPNSDEDDQYIKLLVKPIADAPEEIL